MNPSRGTKAFNAASVMLAGIMFGTLPINIELLFVQNVSLIDQTVLRILMAAGILVLITLPVFGRRALVERGDLPIFFLNGALVLLLASTYSLAILAGETAIVSLLSRNIPIFLVPLSWVFLKERINQTRIAAVILSLAGLIFITQPWGATPNRIYLEEFAATANCLIFSCFIVFNRKIALKHRYHPQISTLWTFACSGLLAAVALLLVMLANPFYTFQPLQFSANQWGLLFSLAFLSTVLPFTLLDFGLKQVEAAKTGFVLLLGPITTMLLGFIMLNEVVRPVEIMGGGLILIGMVLAFQGESAWHRFPLTRFKYAARRGGEVAQANQDRLEFIRHITPGQHVGVFWEDEDDKVSIFVSVVEDGLRRGNFTFVLTSDPEKLSSRLGAAGITSERYGNLRISDARQVFRNGRGFNPESVLDLAREAVDEAVSKGYGGVTWVGDYAHLLYGQRIQSLVGLEERVGKKAPDERMTAFCFLRTNGIGYGELIRLIRSHGHGIFPRIAMALT